MDLNFLYNSFDPKAYKLDNIYNNLSWKDIIQNKSDFCLINQGIQHLFKKNIVIFDLIYKSQNLKFEYEKFNEIFKNSKYSILIILTQDKRRFGAFFKRNFKKDNNTNNIRINHPFHLHMVNNPHQYEIVNYGMTQAVCGYSSNTPLNTINNPTFQKIIFNSFDSEEDYYVFSLDSSEIFYSNNNLSVNIIPSFSIGLNEGILIGKENYLNSIGYKLNGTPKFNIMEIELYSIQYKIL